MMATPTLRIILLVAASAIASVSLAAERNFDRQFTVAPGGKLTLDTDTGSVTVIGRAGYEVVIHASLNGSDDFLSQVTVTADQTSSGVTVSAHKARPNWFSWFGSGQGRVRFTIEVPTSYSIELQTAGGDLAVRNVDASVRGTTSGGNIAVQQVNGSVRMQTSGGNIEAGKINGPTEFRTSGGNIAVADMKGSLNAHTSGGNIDLENIDASVIADTAGGNVKAEMRSNRGIELSTSGGAISLLLPGNVAASIEASTSGGRVSSTLPLGNTENADPSHLRGTLNGGGEHIVLHASGGNIRLGPTT
jgi:hypothetical protein